MRLPSPAEWGWMADAPRDLLRWVGRNRGSYEVPTARGQVWLWIHHEQITREEAAELLAALGDLPRPPFGPSELQRLDELAWAFANFSHGRSASHRIAGEIRRDATGEEARAVLTALRAQVAA